MKNFKKAWLVFSPKVTSITAMKKGSRKSRNKTKNLNNNKNCKTEKSPISTDEEEEKKEAELIKQLTSLHEFSMGLFEKYSRDYSKAFEYVNQGKYNEV